MTQLSMTLLHLFGFFGEQPYISGKACALPGDSVQSLAFPAKGSLREVKALESDASQAGSVFLKQWVATPKRITSRCRGV